MDFPKLRAGCWFSLDFSSGYDDRRLSRQKVTHFMNRHIVILSTFWIRMCVHVLSALVILLKGYRIIFLDVKKNCLPWQCSGYFQKLVIVHNALKGIPLSVCRTLLGFNVLWKVYYVNHTGHTDTAAAFEINISQGKHQNPSD